MSSVQYSARIFGLMIGPKRHEGGIKAPFVDVDITGYDWGRSQYKKFLGDHTILGAPDLRMIKNEMIIPRCDGDEESFPKSSMVYEEQLNMSRSGIIRYVEDFLQGWSDAGYSLQRRSQAITTLRVLEDLQVEHEIDICIIDVPHPGTLTAGQIDIVASSEAYNCLFSGDNTVGVSIEEREVIVYADRKRVFSFSPFDFNDAETEMIPWLLDVLTTSFAKVVEEIMWGQFRSAGVDTLVKSIHASAVDGGYTNVSNPYLK